MRSLILPIVGIFMLMSLPALADQIPVGEGVVLDYTLADDWELFTAPPEALVAEIAEHVEHEAEAQGKHPTEEQIRTVARKRLLANEAIIYHAASTSHLDIDFSPLEEGEKPPSSRILRKSAEYALQSLESEEGVHDVRGDVTKADISGARDAFRIDATYRHHDEPVSFIGIIGFADKNWFFFYFTAPGQDPAALTGVETILDSLHIRSL